MNDQRRRRRQEAKLPYRRVQQDLPLGQSSAVQQLLKNEQLWELVTPELREVYYHYVDIHSRRRDFCAIGWRNENGGWEVRAPGFCGYIGRKGMTFVAGSPNRLIIFPDMTTYLCWRHANKADYPSLLILNHPEFAAAASRRAQRYTSVTVYQDLEPVHLVKHGAAA